MKPLNLKTEIKKLDGKPIYKNPYLEVMIVLAQSFPDDQEAINVAKKLQAKTEDKPIPLTLKDVLITAFTSVIDDDKKLDGPKKHELYVFATRFYDNQSQFTIEEVKKFKDRIGKVYTSVEILGYAYNILEQEIDKDKTDK